MMAAMRSATSAHQFQRLPGMPWAELRTSQQSPHCYRLHMHAQYSLGVVDAGQAVFQHADGSTLLHTGNVVMIEPGAWHACNPLLGQTWSYRMLYLDADWLHALLDVPGVRFTQRTGQDPRVQAGLHALCQALASGHAHPTPWSAELQRWLLEPGLVQALAAPLPTTAALVQPALEQWHQHPDTPRSIQALAQDQGMTASRFIRHFKAATGVTPGTYRLNLRINGARRLLAQGQSLAQAAHAMGFADQAHLQRAFKAHHAATPGCYAQALVTPAPTAL